MLPYTHEVPVLIVATMENGEASMNGKAPLEVVLHLSVKPG